MPRGPLLHADADAFFASVALRSWPELRARPVAVVAHVIVACASYPARARGVRAGMTVVEAQRLCPDVVLVDVPHAAVEEVGEQLLDLFQDVVPHVEPGSIEEAFLDTSHLDWAQAEETARTLRRRAREELRIPVTVGVGRTRLMAKLASRAGKPDGLHVIGPEREAALRTTLPVAQMWGVGARTLERLTALGVERLGDLAAVPAEELRQSVGTTMARRLQHVQDGTDDAGVRPVTRRTSFSAEGSTSGFERPDRSAMELLTTCVTRVCRRAERAGLAGTELRISLRPLDAARPVVLRCAVPEATARAETWLPRARARLAGEPLPALVGLGATLSHLVPVDQVQGALF